MKRKKGKDGRVTVDRVLGRFKKEKKKGMSMC